MPVVSDFVGIYNDLRTFGGNVDGGRYGLVDTGSLTLVPGDLPGTNYTITGASWSAGVATVTIGANNITLNQIISITGVTPSGYNVTGVPVTVTGTSISFALAANPGSWSSGGTVQVNGNAAAAGMLAVNASGVLGLYSGSAWGMALQGLQVTGGPITVDANGSIATSGCIATKELIVSVVAGANNNINIGNAGKIVLGGATGAFNITGFTGGTAGRRLTVFNDTGHVCTVSHQNSGSISANQLYVPQGSDYTAGRTLDEYEFDYLSSAFWVLINRGA